MDFRHIKLTTAMMVVGAVALNSVSFAAEPGLKDILSKPGVAEQMQTSYSGKTTYDGQQDTPLVVQAKKFALRINPPPPPQPVQQPTADNRPIRPKVEVSAAFKLLGTSYHFGDTTQSWALIDEVGKGLHWVKQGSKVGHLNIEKVGDGSVLINDNGRRYELVAERQDKLDLVKSYTGELEKSVPVILSANSEKVTSATTPEIPVVNQIPAQIEPELTPEEQLKNTQNNIEWLKQMQSDPNAGMSDSEANELDGLGQMLKMLEDEAKQLQQQTATGDTNTPNPKADTVPQPKVEEKTQPAGAAPANSEPNKPAEPVKIRRVRTQK
ncbi:MAG: hypothetical protein LLF92_06820 [Planctomycetaceae bacterium]|nr:hypothetical protein [Planctomycetaceae bacterium]